MQPFTGQTLSWSLTKGILELVLHREPCNEIGSATLEELERFVSSPPLSKGGLGGVVGCAQSPEALGGASPVNRALTPQPATPTAPPCQGGEEETAPRVLIIYSPLAPGFSAGADLKELYQKMLPVPPAERVARVREFLTRIHRVFNTLDALPIPVIAAVHGVTFGGGFELALVADLIVADKTARFCFPELRLGLVPGFGGIPRLKRDLGNGLVRDLLLTGRSINAQKAAAAGLVSQLVGEGEALRAARSLAAQLAKFDPATAAAAKRFVKPIPHEELRQEIDLFCELFNRPVVEAALAKFFHSTDVRPYLV